MMAFCFSEPLSLTLILILLLSLIDLNISQVCIWTGGDSQSVIGMQYNGEYILTGNTNNGEPTYIQQNADDCLTMGVSPFLLYKNTNNNLWTFSQILNDKSGEYCECRGSELVTSSNLITQCNTNADWRCWSSVSEIQVSSFGIYGSTCPTITPDPCNSLGLYQTDLNNLITTCVDGLYYREVTTYNTFKKIPANPFDGCDNSYLFFAEKRFRWIEVPEFFWEMKPKPNSCEDIQGTIGVDWWPAISEADDKGWYYTSVGQSNIIPWETFWNNIQGTFNANLTCGM